MSDRQATADRRAAQMWESDEVSRALGAQLVEVGPGRARVALTLEARHCNSFGMCHGGTSFTLGDIAFGYACNSRDQIMVAQHVTISFVAPGHVGDVLTAEAEEVNLSGRNGIFDITVRNQRGERIALLRGACRSIPAPDAS